MLAQPPQQMRGWSTKSRLEMMAFILRCIMTTGDISNLNALASLQKSSNCCKSVLVGLLELNPRCTQVAGDISSLRALAKRQEIILHSVQVTGDISSLSVLTSLQGLILHCVQVTGDISSLSALASLHIIGLSGACGTGERVCW